MRRLVTERLTAWKDSPDRHPLLVRGARQVGKTYSVVDFGRRSFEGKVHVVDFEQRPAARSYFDGDLEPRGILAGLEVLLQDVIRPGRDLLFLDEIQACPRALVALRYFQEQLPALHVIAAGSLIEFALADISFPVGRLDYITMHPMTFREYLWALGNDPMADLVAAGPAPVPGPTHELILGELRRYFFVGGMPAVVRAYREGHSLAAAFARQDALTRSYRDDFGKYGSRVDHALLDDVLLAIPRTVGQRVKYAKLLPGRRSDQVHAAFDLLERASLVTRVTAASPAGLPLEGATDPKRFKALLVDVGLLQRLSGMPTDVEYGKDSLLAIFAGALAEQFVGQELLAAGGVPLHFWARAVKSSTAEVDYLAAIDGRVRAIEVKSGTGGRLRSLHLLLQQFPECAPGIVLSEAPFAMLPEQGLVFMPMYYAGFVGHGGEGPSSHSAAAAG